MSRYKVKPITHPFNAVVEVPGSKSVTNRALLLAALSNEECTLNGVLFSDDSRHFITSLLSLGFKLQVNEVDHYVTVCGCDGDIPIITIY